LTSSYTSAGQIGPISPFLNNKEAPENKTAESLGTALFNCQSFESWSSHSSVNLASIFFVTTAFLGLLAKGSEDTEGYWSSVVNITSISGIIKLAQNHVRLMFLFGDLPSLKIELFDSNLYKVLLQQYKGCCIASHKTALD
jgi:NAD(P)-dependent dehydrogenase (short-subunit alcohol dehydrogenase family)